MKISLAFCLVILALIVNVKIGARPTGKIQGGELLLFNDGGIGEQSGSVVNITEPGLWDVVVANNELAFEVCSSECNGTVLVCYDGDTAGQTTVEECDSGCGFYVATKDNAISLMKPFIVGYRGEQKQNECESFSMINGRTFFRNVSIPVCTPKIENGLVKLNVTSASTDCPVLIKNAHVKTESTTSPPTTKTQFEHASAATTKGGIGSGNGKTTASPPSFMDDYWWIILIIALVVIVGIIIGVVVYCVKCKKDKKSPDAAAAQQNIKESQSPIVQRSKPDAAKEVEKVPPPSYMNESSILSHRSLLQQA